MQQDPQPQINAPPLMPQPSMLNPGGKLMVPIDSPVLICRATGPYFSSQPNGHSLPNPQPAQRQVSPMQSARAPPSVQQQQQSPTSTQHPPGHSGYGLPAPFTSRTQQAAQPSQETLNVERDIIERERERVREQQIQQQQMAQQRHDQEIEMLNQQREQQQRDQQAREFLAREQQAREQHQPPHENHTGAITIQQPVASRMASTLHGPNGILNDQHVSANAPPPQPSAPLGAPSGPGNVFANGVHASDNALRPFVQPVTQNLPPQHLLGLANPVTPLQLSAGAALSQGQQPILNVKISIQPQTRSDNLLTYL